MKPLELTRGRFYVSRKQMAGISVSPRALAEVVSSDARTEADKDQYCLEVSRDHDLDLHICLLLLHS
jgi:hypothetical protein